MPGGHPDLGFDIGGGKSRIVTCVDVTQRRKKSSIWRSIYKQQKRELQSERSREKDYVERWHGGPIADEREGESNKVGRPIKWNQGNES